MVDDIPEEVKNKRNQILLADLEEYASKRNLEFLGRELPVLVEGVSKRNENRWTGRTDLNKTCNFPPVDGIAPGRIVKVKITRTSSNALQGEITE